MRNWLVRSNGSIEFISLQGVPEVTILAYRIDFQIVNTIVSVSALGKFDQENFLVGPQFDLLNRAHSWCVELVRFDIGIQR